jgi:hypothetical protein
MLQIKIYQITALGFQHFSICLPGPPDRGLDLAEGEADAVLEPADGGSGFSVDRTRDRRRVALDGHDGGGA